LKSAAFLPILSGSMTSRLVKQAFALLLGISLILGMAPLAIAAPSMAGMMMASKGMASGPGDCGHCDPGKNDAKPMQCMTACVSPAMAVLPQIDPVARDFLSVSFARPENATKPDGAYPPDPSPPKFEMAV
jgi:hypothetical protein